MDAGSFPWYVASERVMESKTSTQFSPMLMHHLIMQNTLLSTRDLAPSATDQQSGPGGIMHCVYTEHIAMSICAPPPQLLFLIFQR